jgi:NADPH:quinone reductase-like Zn-dependent oxidoreductase
MVEHVWPMIADGRFKPFISHVCPLAEADKAQAQMEADDHAGKVILRVA